MAAITEEGSSSHTAQPGARVPPVYGVATSGKTVAPYNSTSSGRTQVPYSGASCGRQQHKPHQLSEKQKRVEKLLKHVVDGDMEMVGILFIIIYVGIFHEILTGACKTDNFVDSFPCFYYLS